MADWQPGDLALCVRGGFLTTDRAAVIPPESGCIYTVERVGVGEFVVGDLPALWLNDGPINGCGEAVWYASRFVKVTPGADIEGVEVERRVSVRKRA